jgi:hypothetical protein
MYRFSQLGYFMSFLAVVAFLPPVAAIQTRATAALINGASAAGILGLAALALINLALLGWHIAGRVKRLS